MSNNIVVGFRMEAGDAELLKTVCKARREDVSDFIRRSIMKELACLSFLPKDQKKALGVSPDMLPANQQTKEGEESV
jgi:hypothetical protein